MEDDALWEEWFHWCDNGDNEKLSKLLKKVSNLDHESASGWNALQLAALQGHNETVVLLLDAGASIDHGNSNGETALHFAAQNNRAGIVCTLVDRGARVDVQNAAGQTPLEVARTNDVRLALGADPSSLEPSAEWSEDESEEFETRYSIYKINDENPNATLAVRTGPSRKHPVLTYLTAGSHVRMVGEPEGEWARISWENGQAWMQCKRGTRQFLVPTSSDVVPVTSAENAPAVAALSGEGDGAVAGEGPLAGLPGWAVNKWKDLEKEGRCAHATPTEEELKRVAQDKEQWEKKYEEERQLKEKTVSALVQNNTTGVGPAMQGNNGRADHIAPGTIMCFGRGSSGQLGSGRVRRCVSPKQMEMEGRAVASAGGNEHSLFLTARGTVWVCGSNASGQLGDDDYYNNLPRALLFDAGVRIVQVAAGDKHSLFLSDSGEVFAAGSGEHGQTGLATTKNCTMARIRGVLESEYVVAIAAGAKHSLAVAANSPFEHEEAGDLFGACFSWGANEFGQLGLGDTEPRSAPHHVVINGDSDDDDDDAEMIVSVACGSHHSLALTADGRTLAWGLHLKGQCGVPDHLEGSVTLPTLINPLKATCVVQIAAGSSHSLFLTRGGDVLCCGWGTHGQLGLGGKVGDVDCVRSPVRINMGMHSIVQVAAGAFHSYALTGRGEVLGWGRNDDGQLAADPAELQYRTAPAVLHLCGREVTHAQRPRVWYIGAGSSHAIAITGLVSPVRLDSPAAPVVTSSAHDLTRRELVSVQRQLAVNAEKTASLRAALMASKREAEAFRLRLGVLEETSSSTPVTVEQPGISGDLEDVRSTLEQHTEIFKNRALYWDKCRTMDMEQTRRQIDEARGEIAAMLETRMDEFRGVIDSSAPHDDLMALSQRLSRIQSLHDELREEVDNRFLESTHAPWTTLGLLAVAGMIAAAGIVLAKRVSQ